MIIIIIGKTNFIILLFSLPIQAELKQGKELVSVERCSPKQNAALIINLFLLLNISNSPISTSLNTKIKLNYKDPVRTAQ